MPDDHINSWNGTNRAFSTYLAAKTVHQHRTNAEEDSEHTINTKTVNVVSRDHILDP